MGSSCKEPSPSRTRKVFGVRRARIIARRAPKGHSSPGAVQSDVAELIRLIRVIRMIR